MRFPLGEKKKHIHLKIFFNLHLPQLPYFMGEKMEAQESCVQNNVVSSLQKTHKVFFSVSWCIFVVKQNILSLKQHESPHSGHKTCIRKFKIPPLFQRLSKVFQIYRHWEGRIFLSPSVTVRRDWFIFHLSSCACWTISLQLRMRVGHKSFQQHLHPPGWELHLDPEVPVSKGTPCSFISKQTWSSNT